MLNNWLKGIWRGWKRVALAIGRFQTRLLLTLSYFLVAGPTWAFMKLFRKDPLGTRTSGDSDFWVTHEALEDPSERARRQF